MSAEALIFMLGTWALVIALNIFCFSRILRNRKQAEE